MLRKMERAASKIFICFDEKMFTVKVVTDKQNDKNYAHSSRDLLINVRGRFRPQKPARVMFSAAVA